MRSVFTVIGLCLLIGFFAWTIWTGVQSDSRQANILTAVEPSLAPTVFPEPSPVSWSGYVTRSVAGGRGIEVKSVEAQGGWFFAYGGDETALEGTEGSVRVTGDWSGISCEYGRCAPQVEIRTIESLPIVLE